MSGLGAVVVEPKPTQRLRPLVEIAAYVAAIGAAGALGGGWAALVVGLGAPLVVDWVAS